MLPRLEGAGKLDKRVDTCYGLPIDLQDHITRFKTGGAEGPLRIYPR
jgi:hypothetical protein